MSDSNRETGSQNISEPPKTEAIEGNSAVGKESLLVKFLRNLLGLMGGFFRGFGSLFRPGGSGGQMQASPPQSKGDKGAVRPERGSAKDSAEVMGDLTKNSAVRSQAAVSDRKKELEGAEVPSTGVEAKRAVDASKSPAEGPPDVDIEDKSVKADPDQEKQSERSGVMDAAINAKSKIVITKLDSPICSAGKENAYNAQIWTWSDLGQTYCYYGNGRHTESLESAIAYADNLGYPYEIVSPEGAPQQSLVDGDGSLSGMPDEVLLCYASHHGDAATLSRMVESGVSVDVLGEHGLTPLHLAASNGHAAAVKILLGAGADINALTDDNRSPLDMASNDEIRALLEPRMEADDDHSPQAG